MIKEEGAEGIQDLPLKQNSPFLWFYSSAVSPCDGKEYYKSVLKGEFHPGLFNHTFSDLLLKVSPCLGPLYKLDSVAGRVLPVHSVLPVSPSVLARCCWPLCCRVRCEKLPSGFLVMQKALNRAVLFSSGCTLFKSQEESELRAGLVLCCGRGLISHFC